MTPSLHTVFLQALELPKGGRTRFLEGALLPTSVREEASRLLAAHDRADGFMERTLHRARTTLFSRTGDRLGPYLLESVAAQGGMGTVYAARDTRQPWSDGEAPRVAVKLLRPSLTGHPRWASLFLREQAILTRLDHPAVVRLHHAGVDARDCPYLVMEWVTGRSLAGQSREPIAGWAPAFFTALCAAVAHCHRRGVVHGDLKPENVLVTEQGRPKLLDFGVARSIGEAVHLPMTLPYAAPEQVRGDALDASADVHALGVLWYRLRVGRLPPRNASGTPQCDGAGRPRVPRADAALLGTTAAVYQRAAAPEAGSRYPSVRALVAALRAALAESCV